MTGPMRFLDLLDTWAARETPRKTQEAHSIHLDASDAAKIKALAEMFPGVSAEQLISDLLASALDELEASMPYVPGDRVIREDDHGDPVYEDTGLTPRFRELVRDKLGAS